MFNKFDNTVITTSKHNTLGSSTIHYVVDIIQILICFFSVNVTRGYKVHCYI